MKKVLIILISLSLGLGAIAKKDSEKLKSTAPVIAGQVIDNETGETLAGALVKVEGIEKCVFTDLDGQFEFLGLEPGKYKLEVSLISYNSNSLKELKLDGGEQKVLKVQLTR